MEYIRPEANGQLFLEPEVTELLRIPCCLYGFKNEETSTETGKSGRTVFCFKGNLVIEEEERRCRCGQRMHVNASHGNTMDIIKELLTSVGQEFF